MLRAFTLLDLPVNSCKTHFLLFIIIMIKSLNPKTSEEALSIISLFLFVRFLDAGSWCSGARTRAPPRTPPLPPPERVQVGAAQGVGASGAGVPARVYECRGECRAAPADQRVPRAPNLRAADEVRIAIYIIRLHFTGPPVPMTARVHATPQR